MNALTDKESTELLLLLEARQAEIARGSLAEYAEMTLGLIPAKHHLLLIEALEMVDRGELDVLIVTMPPGSAKSHYCSTAFPAWYLGRHPDRCMIAASHTGELAERFGRKVRNIVGSTEHLRVFPDCGLSADSTAAGRWDTTLAGNTSLLVSVAR